MLSRRITSNPTEVHFEDIQSNTRYSQAILLTNNTSQELDISLKPCPTIDRDYEIYPNEFRLAGRETRSIKLSLDCLKASNSRDVIHILTPSFSEKLFVNLQIRDPSHFQEIVKDKDEQLQSSQSRIERLEEEVEDLNEKLRIANQVLLEKARVEQELATVQQENSELRNLIEELKKAEIYHQQLKEMMNQKVPSLENLMSLTLRQEQEKNERKNQKILEILQIKDSLIEDLEDRCEELNNALTLMQHKMNDSKVLLSNTEKSLQNTQKLVEDLKTSNFEKDQTIVSLKNKNFGNLVQEDSSLLKSELLKNFEHVKILSETIQCLEQENQKLKEREEYVLELSNRQIRLRDDHEREVKEKDLVITDLRGKVHMQSEHIETLVSKLSQMNYSEILSKLSSLEEENKALSKRLAESNNSSLTFKKEDLDDGAKAAELEIENEKLLQSLKEYTDRSLKLEEQVSLRNREIINLQNEIIDHKRFKSEMILKAAPSPQEDLTRLASSLRQEQSKIQVLEEENNRLREKIVKIETNNDNLSLEITSLYENLESGNFDLASQNKLIKKINSKLRTLKEKEEEALKAASLAEEGLKVLQSELAQNNPNDVIRELKKIQTDLLQAKSKNDLLTSANLKLKEELEENKKIFNSVQFFTSKEDKNNSKKLRKRVRAPPKLVKALIAAKLAETEAVKKLKLAGKFEIDLKRQLEAKEETIRSLKSETARAFDRVGSLESSEGFNEDQGLLRKVIALEHELNELKEQEIRSWQNFSPFSMKIEENSGKVLDDTELLVEGLLHLVELLAISDEKNEGNEIRDQSSVEKSQRVIIRALFKSIQNDDEKQQKVLSFVPSREEDRKVWYLELLENQFANFTGLVQKLEIVTDKIGSDSGQSVSTSAQMKGLYLELSKSSKALLEEINLIFLLSKLIRSDCESLSTKSKLDGVKIQSLLQEEIEKSTTEKTAQILKYSKENQYLQNELQTLSSKLEKSFTEIKSLQQLLHQQKSKTLKCESEKEELQRAVESLCKELKEESQLKDQALLRVDKAHNELKDWQRSQVELLTDRERAIIDLQSQLKSMREQHLGAIQENIDLHKQNSEVPQELLMQELTSLQAENDSLQRKIFEISQVFTDEKQVLLAKISELEEDLAYEKNNKSDSPTTATIKKDPSIQLASLQVLLKEKITALDEETRKRIEAEGKLRNILTTESLAEKKMEKMEEELFGQIQKLQNEVERLERSENELIQQKDTTMNKFAQLTDALKASTESLRKAEQEIILLQQEQKSQVTRLSSKIKNNDSSNAELKAKVKELAGEIESLQKENEALHFHLKALEKEFEVTSIKLEDSEKINQNLKMKLKDYEKKVEDLEEMRLMESNGNSSRYEQLRLELKLTYEEFEKIAEGYEGMIASLKEQIFNDLKKKSVKRPVEVADLLIQLSKKDSLIRSLRNDLKSKPKKPEKKLKKYENPSSEEEILSLQNQNYKLRAQLKSQETLLQTTREELERVLQQESKPVEIHPKKDIQEIERRHRQDLQKLAEEVARLREKWHSPEEWSTLQTTSRELELNVRKLTEELIRKKEIVENLKAMKDQQDSENCQIQEELEMVKDASDRVKKSFLT
jgi:hypothetical protein